MLWRMFKVLKSVCVSSLLAGPRSLFLGAGWARADEAWYERLCEPNSECVPVFRD